MKKILNKTCCKCKKQLPINQFGKDKQKPDGHKYKCKICEAEDWKSKYNTNPDFRKKHLENGRMWEINNPERHNKRVRDWQKTEKGILASINHHTKRRQNMKEIKHLFTAEEWSEKVKETNGICKMCERPYKDGYGITLDHIIPISKKDGKCEYFIEDVQPLCRSCNSSKSDSI